MPVDLLQILTCPFLSRSRSLEFFHMPSLHDSFHEQCEIGLAQVFLKCKKGQISVLRELFYMRLTIFAVDFCNECSQHYSE